jgi:hypothetical protein
MKTRAIKIYYCIVNLRVCLGAFMAFRGWETEWIMTDEDTKKFM